MEKRSPEYDTELAGRMYGSFLKANRRRRGITPKQISKGLCAASMLSELENGKKQAGWLLRERFLGRIGVAGDDYESYLNCEDFAERKMQKEILKALEQGEAARLNEKLEKYSNQYAVEAEGKKDVVKRLRLQFYLGMKGLCRKLEGAKAEELYGIFGKAVRLSVPGIDEEPMRGLVLCPEEINLILEYVQCLAADEAQRRCKELQSYLQERPMEDDAKVLNYPKVILVLCRMLQKQEEINGKEAAEIVRLCDSGIALLQKTQKTYYLGALLEMKAWALRRIRKQNVDKGEVKRNISLERMLNEIEECKRCFDELYRRFAVSKEEESDAWLYQRKEFFCVGDVIRIRRKMLGMTCRELYDGICSEDTLERLERKKKSTQAPVLWELCIRLGLSPENERTELMAVSPRARELEKEIRHGANKEDFEGNLVRIEELKTLIDLSNKINQQWILRTEGAAKYRTGQMGREEYEGWLRRALECTLPWPVPEPEEGREFYLTSSEMACIYHLSLLDFEENPRKAYERMKPVFFVEQEFEEAGEDEGHISTYELYMKYKATLLHQMGEYGVSSQCTERVIRLCLQEGRANLLDETLYQWMRSIRMQMKKTEPAGTGYDWKKDLDYCLILSRFYKNSVQEEFYKMVKENKYS